MRSWLAVECTANTQTHTVCTTKCERQRRRRRRIGRIRLNAGLSFLLHRGDRINFLVLAIRNPVTRDTYTHNAKKGRTIRTSNFLQLSYFEQTYS